MRLAVRIKLSLKKCVMISCIFDKRKSREFDDESNVRLRGRSQVKVQQRDDRPIHRSVQLPSALPLSQPESSRHARRPLQ